MHYVIDILAAIILLFFFLSGWRRGLLLSALGITRVVLAYGMAYFAGRYLGSWLAEVLYRPRIVMIPVTAGLTFVLISFGIQITMLRIRKKHERKAAAEKHFHLPYHRCFLAGLLSMAAGLLSMIFVFWLGDLLVTGISGRSLPGADRAVFGRIARRTIYEAAYLATAREGREAQAAAMARVIKHPARGLSHLRRVIEADSVRQLLADRRLAEALLAGDPERIRRNASMQRLFHDDDTRSELIELGVLSRHETSRSFSEKLARFGQNEKIQASIQDLQARDMLRTDKVLQLIRDPELDVIVAEMVK